MCGGYLSITKEEMEEILVAVEEENRRLGQQGNPLEVLGMSYDGRRDVVPNLSVPVIVMEEGKVVIKPMKWGFSRWDGKGNVINARVESVDSKPFFRESFLNSRCIIPSSGFYEWKHDAEPSNIFFDALREMTSIHSSSIKPSKRRSTNSQKHLIRKSDSDIFLMAGIYQVKSGVTEFAIITMPAAKSLESIHDRMPLYLENTQIMSWLSSADSLNKILESLSPLASFTTVMV